MLMIFVYVYYLREVYSESATAWLHSAKNQQLTQWPVKPQHLLVGYSWHANYLSDVFLSFASRKAMTDAKNNIDQPIQDLVSHEL